MSAVAQVFEFESIELRTVVIDGEPWFVAADVCAALNIGNTRQAVSYLDDDEVCQAPVTTNDGSGRELPTNVVNEPGLYSMILRSRKPQAKKFKRWITHDVLPSLRKTGTYTVPAQVARRELSRRELAEMVIEAEDRADAEARRAEAAESIAAEKTERLAIAAPKAKTLDAIEAGEGMPLRTFRKSYFPDIPEREFFTHLYRRGFLINQRETGPWDARTQRFRDGAQHGHPAAMANPYLYLHSQLDRHDIRRYHARVRPGQPEIRLRDLLIRQGLTPKLLTDADLERTNP